MRVKNYSLSLNILQELIKKGLRNSVFGFDGSFSAFELGAIEELTITNCNGLSGLELLTNLKSLKIVSSRLDSFDDQISLNKFKNFMPINQLYNLEKLAIYNDPNAINLNITNLTKLRKLTLLNNSKLAVIKGLHKLKNLEKVVISNCDLSDIGDIREYIINTRDVEVNILDINYTTKILGIPKIREFIKNMYNFSLTNIRFGEHVYFYDEIYSIDIYQAIDMYHRATRILRDLNIKEYDDARKAMIIYYYVITHLEYDYSGLAYRNNEFKNTKEGIYYLRRMSVINSSFGAFTSHKVVCDGYVNMMRYLLKRCNIKSRTVLCQNENEMSHAAIKYLINGNWYYADPEKDRDPNNIQYYNLTKKEMAKLYRLSYKEDYDNQRKEEEINYGRYLK